MRGRSPAVKYHLAKGVENPTILMAKARAVKGRLGVQSKNPILTGRENIGASP